MALVLALSVLSRWRTGVVFGAAEDGCDRAADAAEAARAAPPRARAADREAIGEGLIGGIATKPFAGRAGEHEHVAIDPSHEEPS